MILGCNMGCTLRIGASVTGAAAPIHLAERRLALRGGHASTVALGLPVARLRRLTAGQPPGRTLTANVSVIGAARGQPQRRYVAHIRLTPG
jgi:hypothetical protein